MSSLQILADIHARFVRRREGPFAEIQSGKERCYYSSLLYLGLFQGYFTDLSSVTNTVRDTLERRELPLRGCDVEQRKDHLPSEILLMKKRAVSLS